MLSAGYGKDTNKGVNTSIQNKDFTQPPVILKRLIKNFGRNIMVVHDPSLRLIQKTLLCRWFQNAWATELGEIVTARLSTLPGIVNVKFTAEMESKTDDG